MVPNNNEIEELKKEEAELKAALESFKNAGLALDMTRGKPAPAQLDLSLEMLSLPGKDDYKANGGTDCRNYGLLDGLPETKAFFAEYMGVAENEVIIGGNSSLALMHDTLTFAVLHGYPESEKAWSKQESVKFLCPVPGYDRHFSVCQTLGIEMIPVDMDENGPDMQQVRNFVKADSAIKGMWCVPQYSNPTGITYSAQVVKQLASMETAASDFKIMWDNAYAAHHLSHGEEQVQNLLKACKKAGNPNRALMYGSTSKISLAGAGIAVLASSEANITWYKKYLSMQTIGFDKINQLRHLRFFKNVAGLKEHMKKHAEILQPKFEKVDEVLNNELGNVDYVSWTKPKGGYFISLDVPEGCATRVVALCAESGVKMTAAGATFPYGKDPKDSNIRIAPSLPSVAEIKKAMQVLCTCIKLATLGKYA